MHFQEVAAAAGACSSTGGGGGSPPCRLPSPPTDPFLGSLSREVERVAAFVAAHLEQLWLRLLEAAAELRGSAGAALPQHHQQGPLPPPLSLRLAALRSELDELGQDLVLVREAFVICSF